MLRTIVAPVQIYALRTLTPVRYDSLLFSEVRRCSLTIPLEKRGPSFLRAVRDELDLSSRDRKNQYVSCMPRNDEDLTTYIVRIYRRTRPEALHEKAQGAYA